MKLKHSFSSLKMFDNCPLRYYRQRIKKDVVDPGGEASIYGERVHKSFEDRIRDKTPLPPELGKHEKLCQSIEGLAVGGSLKPEAELTLTKDLTPTGWWDDDAWLRLKADVLVVTKTNDAVVLDYKTGKRRPDFFQLELGALQVFQHYPEVSKVATSFVWLRDGGALDSEVFRRDKKEVIEKKLRDKTTRIEEAIEEEVWPAKPGPLCNYCPARETCSYADTGRRRR